jgi:DNA mismatch endonuclease (patch repair protein)
VFTRPRLAVFIDGCFWHGCPEHGQRSQGENAHYWGPKIARNAERDVEHSTRLTAAGWTVLRFWEHEAPERVAKAVSHAYRGLLA